MGVKKIITIVAIVLLLLFVTVYKVDNKIKITVDDSGVEMGIEIENLGDALVENDQDELTENTQIDTIAYVYGEIENPGYYDVNTENSINDLINMAGGLKKTADITIIDTNKKIVMNEIIKIPVKDEILIYNSISSKYYSIEEFNNLDLEELAELNGIGQVIAKRILDWKIENGNFENFKQLQEVNGIGEKKYEGILEF